MIKSFLLKWRGNSPLFKFRLFLGLIILVLILIFLYLKIVPGGAITYSRPWPAGLKSGKGFINDFKPAERIDLTDQQALKIVAEPVYFSLFTPRRFDSALVTIKYRAHLDSQTPLIEVGVLKDKLTGHYELKPVENRIIDYWRSHWSSLEDSNSRLILSVARNYLGPAEFLADLEAGHLRNCPGGPTTCVATYNYPLNLSYRLPDSASSSPLIIDQPLRGAHQFYVYFKNEPWRLKFDFVDLNQDKGQDPITVTLYAGDKVVATESLPDNNPAPTSGQPENKELLLTGVSAAAGIYRIDVKISDDVVISKITSSSNRLAAIHKIWPVSGTGNLTLFSDASNLTVSTANPASLGEIYFGGLKFILDKTDRQLILTSSDGIKEIRTKKDDLIMESNGVFAFSRAGLLNPGLRSVDRYFSPDDNIKYIVADYQAPLSVAGLKIATAKFSLVDAYREDGKYTLVLSIPGLNGLDPANYLEIKEISVALSGKTWWTKVKSWFIKN